MAPTSARPPFKWAGGKRALAPTILDRFPRAWGCYHEPFLGAGAVFVALANRFADGELFHGAQLDGAPYFRLSDANANVVNAWRIVRDHVEELIALLGDAAEYANDRPTFERIRAANMQGGGEIRRAADFLYLNRFGFNGLYRVNRKGEFNVPFGDNPRASISFENLSAVSALLRRCDVALDRSDFATACLAAKTGDVVYLDPPYVPTSKTASFAAYEPGGFGAADHERLRDVFAGLVARGVHAILSNSDVPIVRDLYARFRIEEVLARRAVNCMAGKRGEVKELLILPELR